MNGGIFRSYVEQVRAAMLAPGDIVILDNLGSHKVAGVRAAIEARGASLVYLQSERPSGTRICCPTRCRIFGPLFPREEEERQWVLQNYALTHPLA